MVSWGRGGGGGGVELGMLSGEVQCVNWARELEGRGFSHYTCVKESTFCFVTFEYG